MTRRNFRTRNALLNLLRNDLSRKYVRAALTPELPTFNQSIKFPSEKIEELYNTAECNNFYLYVLQKLV